MEKHSLYDHAQTLHSSSHPRRQHLQRTASFQQDMDQKVMIAAGLASAYLVMHQVYTYNFIFVDQVQSVCTRK